MLIILVAIVTVNYLCALKHQAVVVHARIGQNRNFCQYTPLIPALGRQRQRQSDLYESGQLVLQSVFQDCQGYTEKPCLKQTKH